MAVAGESWGRWPRVEQRLLPVTDRRAPLPAFDGHALPHGNGRSYGDSCLDPGGTLLHARGLDRFIAFDAATGVLDCEAGVTLAEILEVAVPRGWFLPVTPGTAFATVGGAIANDVHGKNHHVAGSFGDHVDSFELLRSDGTRTVQVPGDALFAATVGGLGLTGLVTRARLRLRPVPGPWMETESIRFGGLDEFFALSAESAARFEYTVAWIDCLAPERQLGRGHFIRGDHASQAGGTRPPAPARRLAMPVTPPFALVNRLTLKPFNLAYYHRQRADRVRAASHYSGYFYPLDGIGDWNRMYGPRGFLQHQCVLPPAAARDALAAMLGEIRRAGQGSFLAVLKEFGDRPAPGMLSFPRAGTTLALDFPNTGEAVFALLDRLDAIVVAAGGAIYPAKDARMSPATFRAGFPGWPAFAAHVDPALSSGFWRRVTEQS